MQILDKYPFGKMAEIKKTVLDKVYIALPQKEVRDEEIINALMSYCDIGELIQNIDNSFPIYYDEPPTVPYEKIVEDLTTAAAMADALLHICADKTLLTESDHKEGTLKYMTEHYMLGDYKFDVSYVDEYIKSDEVYNMTLLRELIYFVNFGTDEDFLIQCYANNLLKLLFIANYYVAYRRNRFK